MIKPRQMIWEGYVNTYGRDQKHVKNFDFKNRREETSYKTQAYTQYVQVLSGLCSLKIKDVNYFQNFTVFIQNSVLLNQYIAGID
jgi:hypothetical protein